MRPARTSVLSGVLNAFILPLCGDEGFFVPSPRNWSPTETRSVGSGKWKDWYAERFKLGRIFWGQFGEEEVRISLRRFLQGMVARAGFGCGLQFGSRAVRDVA